MDAHDQGVTRHRLTAENRLNDAWYDEVLVEEEYFETENTPLQYKNGFSETGCTQGGVEGPKGEVDVWLLNRDEKVMYCIEVKTNYSDLGYGREQLDRVENHFEGAGWDVVSKLWLED